jgi:hypothetical protein
VFVAFFLEVGLLLVVMPWWPALWDNNFFAEASPALQRILTNNYVRGAVTGLGLVNLVGGFADLALIFSARPHGPAGREPQEYSERS